MSKTNDRAFEVMQELQQIADAQGVSVAMAIYMLGFSTYNGFNA